MKFIAWFGRGTWRGFGRNDANTMEITVLWPIWCYPGMQARSRNVLELTRISMSCACCILSGINTSLASWNIIMSPPPNHQALAQTSFGMFPPNLQASFGSHIRNRCGRTPSIAAPNCTLNLAFRGQGRNPPHPLQNRGSRSHSTGYTSFYRTTYG